MASCKENRVSHVDILDCEWPIPEYMEKRTSLPVSSNLKYDAKDSHLNGDIFVQESLLFLKEEDVTINESIKKGAYEIELIKMYGNIAEYQYIAVNAKHLDNMYYFTNQREGVLVFNFAKEKRESMIQGCIRSIQKSE